MKSFKPGRYNSAQGVVVSIFGIVFAIVWIVMAVNMGAPIIFPIFGVGFIIVLITELVKNIHNTTSENRYSEFDIVDSTEEPDPWNEKMNNDYGKEQHISNGNISNVISNKIVYCPYCGFKIANDFEYCPKCGRKLPF